MNEEIIKLVKEFNKYKTLKEVPVEISYKILKLMKDKYSFKILESETKIKLAYVNNLDSIRTVTRFEDIYKLSIILANASLSFVKNMIEEYAPYLYGMSLVEINNKLASSITVPKYRKMIEYLFDYNVGMLLYKNAKHNKYVPLKYSINIPTCSCTHVLDRDDRNKDVHIFINLSPLLYSTFANTDIFKFVLGHEIAHQLYDKHKGDPSFNHDWYNPSGQYTEGLMDFKSGSNAKYNFKSFEPIRKATRYGYTAINNTRKFFKAEPLETVFSYRKDADHIFKYLDGAIERNDRRFDRASKSRWKFIKSRAIKNKESSITNINAKVDRLITRLGKKYKN